MYRLYRGDCLELMRDLPDGSVDMVLCDLPYGVTANDKDVALPFGPLWEQYGRVVKEDGAIVLFAQGLFYVDLVSSNRKMFRYDLVWDKVLTTGFLNAKRMPLRQHEQVAVFYRKLPRYNPQMSKGSPNHGKGTRVFAHGVTNRNYGEFHAVAGEYGDLKYPGSVIREPKPHPSRALHRTEKPVGLLEWLIRTYTDSGETVLDNCMGSGSTGEAALRCGRDFVGMELDEYYYGVAERRISTVAALPRGFASLGG